MYVRVHVHVGQKYSIGQLDKNTLTKKSLTKRVFLSPANCVIHATCTCTYLFICVQNNVSCTLTHTHTYRSQ